MNIENVLLSEGSHILYNIKKPRIGKSMETENRAVIVRGWRRRELEGPVSPLKLGKWWNVLELVVFVVQHYEYSKNHWVINFKIVPTVNFILWILSQLKKKKKKIFLLQASLYLIKDLWLKGMSWNWKCLEIEIPHLKNSGFSEDLYQWELGRERKTGSIYQYLWETRSPRRWENNIPWYSLKIK